MTLLKKSFGKWSSTRKKDEFTDRLDRIFTDKTWGIPIFLLIMAFIFFLTFTVGDFLSGFLEDGISALTDFMAAAMSAQLVAKPLQSLILDGACGGGNHHHVSSQYPDSFSEPGFFGGQWLYGPRCLCHGKYHGKGWVIGPCLYPYARWFRMYRACHYGIPRS